MTTPATSGVKAGFDRRAVFAEAKARNLMRHAEVAEALAAFLASRFSRPFFVLDLGCGAAEELCRVLAGTAAAGYLGVDDDPEAVGQAERNLAALSCPRRVVTADFLDVVNAPNTTADVIWLGLFLHHLEPEGKRAFFARAARILRPGGAILVHDPLPRDDETLDRFRVRLLDDPGWRFLSPSDREVLLGHFSRGHAETLPALAEAASAAGLGQPEVLFRDQTQTYALLAFSLDGQTGA